MKDCETLSLGRGELGLDPGFMNLRIWLHGYEMHFNGAVKGEVSVASCTHCWCGDGDKTRHRGKTQLPRAPRT